LGDIYAQPLYVSNVGIPGHGTANVLLVATMNGFVFALDADSPRVGSDGVFWKRNLGPPPSIDDVWRNCSPSFPCPGLFRGTNIRGNLGIMGTPIIDRNRGIVFVVARMLVDPDHVIYRLHALDLREGVDLAGSPVEIEGEALGVEFNPNDQNQRPGLALARDQIIVAFGSYADFLPYHGWVFSYRHDDSGSFVRTGIFVTTPDGDTKFTCAVPAPTPSTSAANAATAANLALAATHLLAGDVVGSATYLAAAAAAKASADEAAEPAAVAAAEAAANSCAQGGIWMAGRAPAVDTNGRVLVMIGNGRNDMSATPRNFGNSLVALNPVTLSVADFFTPENRLAINAMDLDLGGSGPMIIPSPMLSLAEANKG
jgi:hypothetical protein